MSHKYNIYKPLNAGMASCCILCRKVARVAGCEPPCSRTNVVAPDAPCTTRCEPFILQRSPLAVDCSTPYFERMLNPRSVFLKVMRFFASFLISLIARDFRPSASASPSELEAPAAGDACRAASRAAPFLPPARPGLGTPLLLPFKACHSSRTCSARFRCSSRMAGLCRKASRSRHSSLASSPVSVLDVSSSADSMRASRSSASTSAETSKAKHAYRACQHPSALPAKRRLQARRPAHQAMGEAEMARCLPADDHRPSSPGQLPQAHR